MTVADRFPSSIQRAVRSGRVLRTTTFGLLVATALALGSCATTGVTAPSVVRLTTAQYPPTQVVDILNAPPASPFQRIARLQVDDSTGTATQSQLVAQLVTTARSLGANALVVGAVQRSGGSAVAFNPSGGQIQDSDAAVAVSMTAVAIRYTH